MLEDRAGAGVDELAQTADLLVQAARRRPELGNVVNTFRSNVPSYKVDVDLDKVQTLGIPVTDAYNALQTFLGGLYVNDFNVFGRTWQVLVQAEPEFRTAAARHQPFLRPDGRGQHGAARVRSPSSAPPPGPT